MDEHNADISQLRTWKTILDTYYKLLKTPNYNEYVMNSMADWLDSELLKDERNDPILREL